jgi:peptide/nickel transport system permease protein
VYGARVSLTVAAFALLSGGLIGLAVGIIAGYLGGRVDSILMRVVDATLTFPTILIALLLAVSLGAGLRTIVIAITVIIWARFARVVRGEVLGVRARDFVSLARVHGCSSPRIMLVHIVPNVMNTFMVLLTLHIGFVIIVEASLSFLGAGIPPPTPSWGQMVADGRSHIASAWWLAVMPGAAIMLVVLAFNLFGDWLRDWLDPRLRQV